MTPGELLLTVVYAGSPDEIFEFHTDGQARSFGRDDDVCDIVIWSAINSRRLSRVAGRIWRADGELWVRNLSRVHELTIVEPDQPPQSPLPPRTDHGPGAARSLPAGVSLLLGPDGCELIVRQERTASPDTVADDDQLATVGLPPLPEELRMTAVALCEPLLRGGRLPATYSDVVRRLGNTSLKRVRVAVAELSRRYEKETPALESAGELRRERAAANLDAGTSPVLRGGIWRFEADSGGPETRGGFVLPDYYAVAHLLVRRFVVTFADLADLG